MREPSTSELIVSYMTGAGPLGDAFLQLARRVLAEMPEGRECAERCCETRQEVVKGTKEVLEKVSALELDRVRAELDDAKAEISNLKQTVELEELIERRCRRHGGGSD